jgi:hypothetical protein
MHANAPHAKYVARKGKINAWDNPRAGLIGVAN